MKLIAFRVTMYKGIIDSGWVDVNRLTVLVGKNESGKTSLLRALHKFNPYIPDLYKDDSDSYEDYIYQIDWEWPRAHRTERSEDQVVCRVRFQLSNQEKLDLAQIAEGGKIPDTIEVSQNYAGQLEVHCEEDILSDKLPSSDIDNAFDALPTVQDEFNDQFKEIAYECLKEARHLADEGWLTELTQLAQKYQPLLGGAISPLDPPQQPENDFINQYFADLEWVVRTLEPLLSIQERVDKYVADHLPTFIYMDDYRIFSGTAQLDEIQARLTEDRLTEEDQTFLAILSLSDLDLDELVQLGQGNTEAVKQRQYNVAAGADTLTRIISDRLSQRHYAVDFRVDGQRFFTFVKDDRDPSLIELEERSKGFQWFFSFDLMFMHESKGTFEDCVILLDEPGLHLHPNAQKDLLRRLENYAKGNTLLYTTHLPFMIDLNQPDRIRVLKETNNGIVVTTDLIDSPPEAKFVLQAALGMDASQSFLVAKRNLVVEGVDDYLVLTALSNLLQEDGAEGLPEDVHITPGGGASEAVRIASFMIGQKLDVVVLFDSDKAGKDAKDKLEKEWLTRYTESKTKVILLGCAVGISHDFAIEDLFPDEFITDIVKEFHRADLARAGVTEIILQGNDMLWKRIERFMAGKGIKINKGPIAKRLGWKINGMKDSSELPHETRERAIKLFQEIRGDLQGKKTRKS